MPFKFWKRDKPVAPAGPAPAPQPPVPEPGQGTPAEASPAAQAAPVPEAQPAAPAPQIPPEELIPATVAEVHVGLVDLGLTIPATKGVFEKRVAGFPGGAAAFVETYKAAPYRATTRLLAEWLGFRAPAEFDPEGFLQAMNLRLSSFKLVVKMTDLTWLDQDLGLRKARLNLDGQEKVVRFKDARDFVKGVNDLLASKKIVFLELETWSGEFAFMLVRDPRWEKLAATNLVVVKAPQTAVGGECGECGAPVGTNWHDCLSCGAVFGSE